MNKTVHHINYMAHFSYLDLLREGGTKHHSLAQPFRGHSVLLHNTTDLWFKTHIQHPVSFIQDQVTAT